MQGAPSRLRRSGLCAGRTDVALLTSPDSFGLWRAATRTGREPQSRGRYTSFWQRVRQTLVTDILDEAMLRTAGFHCFLWACSNLEWIPSASKAPSVILRPVSTATCTLYSHVPYMDKASQALAHGVPTGVPRSYRAVADHSGVPCSTLYHRAHGRQSIEAKAQAQQYLVPFEEQAVVKFILQMAELGTPVRIKYIPSIAFTATRHRSEADRPAEPPNKNWSKAFETRHPELRARKVRALDWNRHEKNIYHKIEHWFELIAKVLEEPAVLDENVYNMDETGVMPSMLGSVKALAGRKDLRDYRGARVKRTVVTAIECISADGRYLDPMVIWPGATHRSNWTTYPTPGWHYACSESGYTDSQISFEWLTRVFDPQTKERANGKPRLLICDGFGTHETLEILEHCFANNIRLCRLPSHTSHKLQPCDVAVFAPLKTAYRDAVERLERGGVNTIGKQHFTSLYSSARKAAFTKRNIRAGWSKCGLTPLNPQRVLKDMEKPLTELSEAARDLTLVLRGLQHETPTLPVVPVTPVTPVTAEAFASLRDMILERDAHAMDDAERQNLKRHLDKLTRAAQTSIAEGALLQEDNRFVRKMNNEAKVRRSTKSLVLGKARVISYEDLEAVRLKRLQKEADKASKSKRGQRRKGEAKKACISGVVVDDVQSGAPGLATYALQANEQQPEYDIGVLDPCPGRAPTARMW